MRDRRGLPRGCRPGEARSGEREDSDEKARHEQRTEKTGCGIQNSPLVETVMMEPIEELYRGVRGCQGEMWGRLDGS